MYKTLDSSFEMTWSGMALGMIDQLGQDRLVSEFPEVVAELEGVRLKILNVDPDIRVESLFSNIQILIDLALKSVRLSADEEERAKADSLSEKILELRRKFVFLERYFDFQVENFENRLKGGEKFAIRENVDFMRKYPEYQASPLTFRRRVRRDFNSYFDELAGKMGLPFPDSRHPEELKTQLSFELWRVYNRKNNLPVANRKYTAGTQLPRQGELLYYDDFFVAEFGSFSDAVKKVILSPDIAKESNEGIEKLSQHDIDELLEVSMRTGELPQFQAMGLNFEDFEKKRKAVVYELEHDLYAAIEKMTVVLPCEHGDGDRKTYAREFNWPLLLVASRYFGRYGVKIYNIWLDSGKLDNLTNHVDKRMAGILKGLFFKNSRLRHMKKIGNWVDITSYSVDAAEVVRQKAEFYTRHPEIPLYMRQLLLQRSRTSVKDIEDKIVFFEESGVDKKWYVHFLHVPGHYHLNQAVFRLRKISRDYERIEKFHRERDDGVEATDLGRRKAVSLRERFARYLPPDQVPDLHELCDLGVQKIKQRLDKAEERGEPVTIALITGEGLKKGRRPGKTGSLNGGKNGLSAENRDRAPKAVLENVHEKRLAQFIEERGITPPPAYLGIGAARIMELIDEIEVRGVPFRSEYWWWLNSAAAQRDSQIEHTWMKLSRDKRRAELAEIYGFDLKGVPARVFVFEPDKILEYARVIDAVGHKVGDYWARINQFNKIRFRYYLRDKLVKKSRRVGLSDRENNYLRKIGQAEKLKLQFGDVYGAIKMELLVEEAEVCELDILESGAADSAKTALLEVLAERIGRKRELENLLRRYRFAYADMNYFCASMERVELAFQRIHELERLKLEVGSEALYEEVFDLARFDNLDNEDDLNDEQMDVVVYLCNVGCDDLWARKLAKNGENLEELRQKVLFFEGVELDPGDYGKDKLEVVDYEGFLDRSIAELRRVGLKRLKARLANGYAREKLSAVLGEEFDKILPWKKKRTSYVTASAKFNLLQDGVLKNREVAVAQIVTGFSKDSVSGLVDFAEKLYVVIGALDVSDEQKALYLELMIGVLIALSKIFNSAKMVSPVFLDKAKDMLLAGEFDRDFFAKVQGVSGGRLQSIGDEMLLKVYQGIIAEMNFPDVSSGGLLSREEEKKLLQLKDIGDRRAVQILVQKNIRYVVKVAKRYAWSGLPMEDLIQEGNVGLLKAIEKSDWRKGFKLLTYATWWIRQSIGRYVLDNARNVRLPVYLQEMVGKYLRVEGRFLADNHREATDEELAEMLGVKPDKVESIRAMAKKVRAKEVFLDAPIGDDEKSASRMDLTGEESKLHGQFEAAISRKQFIDKLKREFFRDYPGRKVERDWDIFVNRFGFVEGEEVMALQELATKHGVTHQAIGQREVEVLDFIKMRPGLVGILRELVDKK